MKAELAGRTPVKNICEETRLDPAQGGSTFWDLVPRVLGLTFNSFCFKNAIGVLIKQYLLRNISAGRLQVAAAFLFFGESKCFITKKQILAPEAFLGTRKWSKPNPRDLPGTPKWLKSSPRAPPTMHTITRRTLQGSPRGQLDVPEDVQAPLGSVFGSPADPAEPSKPLRFLKEIHFCSCHRNGNRGGKSVKAFKGGKATPARSRARGAYRLEGSEAAVARNTNIAIGGQAKVNWRTPRALPPEEPRGMAFRK
jgi:hypothetical protein